MNLQEEFKKVNQEIAIATINSGFTVNLEIYLI